MKVQDMTHTDSAVAELDATRKVYEALKSLGGDAQARVLIHVSGLLDIKGVASSARRQSQSNDEEAALQHEQKAAPKFSTLAELFNAADPHTNAQKALVAGYWFQVCQGAETFDGFSARFKVSGDLYDCGFQRKLARLMIEDDYAAWKNWYNSVAKKGVGYPPKES